MMRFVVRLDALLAASRPLWGWLAEIAVVFLGVHLAADRLDDVLADWIARIHVAWPDPETPLAIATWCAIGVELVVCAWAGVELVRSTAPPAASAKEWGRRLTARG